MKNTNNRDYLREDFDHLFAYDPETGHLHHKPRTGADFPNAESPHRANMLAAIWNGRFAGRVAGTKNQDGYVRLQIGRKPFLAHRVAYALMEGVCPASMDIDHIKGVRDDNRWSEIRIVSRMENQWNRKQSPTQGVYTHHGAQGTKYRAFIRIQMKLHYLGSFDTEAEAIAARKAKQDAYAEEMGFMNGRHPLL